jgi:hypothetical protein
MGGIEYDLDGNVITKKGDPQPEDKMVSFLSICSMFLTYNYSSGDDVSTFSSTGPSYRITQAS